MGSNGLQFSPVPVSPAGPKLARLWPDESDQLLPCFPSRWSPKNRKAAVLESTGGHINAGLYLRTGYVLSLQTLRAPFHLELHLRAFFQRPITIHLDR